MILSLPVFLSVASMTRYLSFAFSGSTDGPTWSADIKVGDMIYNIKSRKAADQVGPSVLPEKANDKYLVIEATLKNTGNDKITVE